MSKKMALKVAMFVLTLPLKLRMALVESHQKYRHHQTATPQKQKQNMPSQ